MKNRLYKYSLSTSEGNWHMPALGMCTRHLEGPTLVWLQHLCVARQRFRIRPQQTKPNSLSCLCRGANLREIIARRGARGPCSDNEQHGQQCMLRP